MDRIAALRFFCSHNCFQIYDATLEPWGEPSEIDGLTPMSQDTKLMRGWYRAGDSLVYRTWAHGNDHRIDVFRSASPPPDAPHVDRVLIHNLRLPSGRLVIFGLDYGETIDAPAGDYVVYCRAFNLGADRPYDQTPLTDEEFMNRDDLERYELVLVHGRTDREGVISGPETLDAFVSRRRL